MRTTEKINRDWLFALGDKGEYAKEGTSETDFRPIQLPHDWSNDYPLEEDAPTGGGGGYGRAEIGWYRKHLSLNVPQGLEEKFFIYFEGVYMDSTVYINGVEAGGHGYGYSSFTWISLISLKMEKTFWL